MPSASQIKLKDIIDNPKKVVEAFKKFFVNVGPNTENNIPINPKIIQEQYLKNRNQFNFLIAHISNAEVLDIINQLESKSAGLQSIPIKLLKLIPDLILIPLCMIINQSFFTGKYPDALKISKVISIHKSGETCELNNYRPISSLSIFNKIMEKLMHKQHCEFSYRNIISSFRINLVSVKITPQHLLFYKLRKLLTTKDMVVVFS